MSKQKKSGARVKRRLSRRTVLSMANQHQDYMKDPIGSSGNCFSASRNR